MKGESVHSALRRSRVASERLAYWIIERELIRKHKERGDPPPWTEDPLLREWRFCNVRREDDRVTRWLEANWRKPHAKDPALWHAMLVARFINWPDTLAECGWPEPWPVPGRPKTNAFLAAMRARMTRGDKVFTGAYLIGNGGQSTSKIDHVAVLFNQASFLRDPPRAGDTLREAHSKLRLIPHVGSFMAAQVVADLKHTPVLQRANDWHDWAAPGPGSMRGLNRVQGNPLDQKWRDDSFVAALAELRREVGKLAPMARDLCLQDIQSALCEFDKFERVLHGEGKPRQRYVPTTG